MFALEAKQGWRLDSFLHILQFSSLCERLVHPYQRGLELLSYCCTLASQCGGLSWSQKRFANLSVLSPEL